MNISGVQTSFTAWVFEATSSFMEGVQNTAMGVFGNGRIRKAMSTVEAEEAAQEAAREAAEKVAVLYDRYPDKVPPPDHKIGQPGSSLWWKPWRVPESVEKEIAVAFTTEASTEEQIREALRILLPWRLGSIPNADIRKKAIQAAEKAFETGTFMGHDFATEEEVQAHLENLFAVFPEEVRAGVPRTYKGFKEALKGGFDVSLSEIARLSRFLFDFELSYRFHLGAFFPQFPLALWINPRIRRPDYSVTLDYLMIHEAGGHLAGWFGADGLFSKIQDRLWGNRLLVALDPLRPLTHRIGRYLSEGRGIGAEWELLHRIPSDKRQALLDTLRDLLGEHYDLTNYWGPFSFLHKYRNMHRHYPEDLESRLYYTTIAMLCQALAISHLPKRKYIFHMRRIDSYSVTGRLFHDTLAAYALMKEGYGAARLVAPWITYPVKLAAYYGAYRLFFG